MDTAGWGETIDRNRLLKALAGQSMGGVIECHDEIGSTNDRARELADLGQPHGTVVVAEEQTAGRGRRGAAWCGVPGRDLMVSVLLRPSGEAVLSRVPLVAALALARAVMEQAGLKPLVKWPNDLWLNDRKLAGVLSETSGPAVVLGLGCNINSQAGDRSAEVAGLAISLREAAAEERWWDRTSLLLSLLRQLQLLWPAVSDPVSIDPDLCLPTGSGLPPEFRNNNGSPWRAALGQLATMSQLNSGYWMAVELNGQVITVRMEGLGHDGQLWVSDRDGRRQALYQVDRIRPLASG